MQFHHSNISLSSVLIEFFDQILIHFYPFREAWIKPKLGVSFANRPTYTTIPSSVGGSSSSGGNGGSSNSTTTSSSSSDTTAKEADIADGAVEVSMEPGEGSSL